MNKPIFYLAPMLGITDASYRKAFTEVIGGFDYAIAPFIRTLQGQRYKKSHFNDLYVMTRQLTVCPQILTNNTEDFIHLALNIQSIGYNQINLNLGCPVPSASGKGRGAGLIPEVELVDQMLEQFFSSTKLQLSIKTRIGLTQEDELLKLIPILNRYPLFEVVIHPRTATQKYSGTVNLDQFKNAASQLKMPVVYSGDINSPKDFVILQNQLPEINRWMLGRGILKNPFLLHEIREQTKPDKVVIYNFFENLIENYLSKNYTDHIILTRIQPHLVFLGQGFDIEFRSIRKLLKLKNLIEFKQQLFSLIQQLD